MLRRFLRAATAAAISLGITADATAAQLHWPLPPDSLERNGSPEPATSHTKLPRQMPKIAPLPNRGLHPQAAEGLKRRYSGTAIDVLRYHYDNYPTGWNQSETDLTPSTVASASFGQLTTLNVDGNVIAQPLLVSNFQMPDGSTHNVLIVVTGHDTVYAFDAQTYSVLWQRSLGIPQSSNDVGCSDVVPEYGISSTPVIIRNGNSATIYLAAATEPARYSFHTKLHALDLGNGNDLLKAVEIDPRARLKTGGVMHFDPQHQWSRASLAYANGAIYMGIGSHCDDNAGSISGWLLRYDPATLKLTAKFNTIEAAAGYELSSVWMAGYSPAVDLNGNVFAVTGNGNYNLGKGMKGYGESVLSLSSDLSKRHVGTFTPSNWSQLNAGDADFGSGGAMLIPFINGQSAPPMLVATGKAGKIYLLNASNLGGEGDSHALQIIQLSGCWCGAAYYGSPNGGILYYQTDGDVLHGYSVNPNAQPYLAELSVRGTSTAGYGGSFPIVSSNGQTAGTAVVWLIRRGTTEQLEAYDAINLGNPLFQANAGSWNTGGSFLTPLVANGRVYVPAYKTVTVFGLTN